MFVPVPANALAKQRRYMRIFRDQGATSPDRAMTLSELGTHSSFVFRRMVRAGVFVAMPGGQRFYLSEPAAEAFRQRQAQRVVWALAAVTIVLVVALIITWTIR